MELAKQQDKLIEIKIDKSDIHINPDLYKEFFSSLLHVFRNAIDHGIESREERIAKNKKEKATLYILFDRIGDNTFKTIIKDDGKGIDPKVIKDIASQKENLKSIEFGSLSEKEIIQLIFRPGFSSKEEVSEISGRGVGMDAVKTEVEKLEGTIKVDSKIDIGTKFEIVLPIYD
jgi:two-component system chemotaxis sensor kinase CheA